MGNLGPPLPLFFYFLFLFFFSFFELIFLGILDYVIQRRCVCKRVCSFLLLLLFKFFSLFM
jgi:hypothetical protein